MDLSFLASPDAWLTLVTLSALEIVLGIDNLVFISIAVSRLPEERKPLARRLGIAVACVTRILLLVTLAFLARMSQDLFQLFGQGISIRDLVLVLGGAFLLVKGVLEIRDLITGGEDEDPRTTKTSAVFALVIAQIAVIDIVFSLDSVITASSTPIPRSRCWRWPSSCWSAPCWCSTGWRCTCPSPTSTSPWPSRCWWSG
jgi:predicted tellurium resistance membrane protein TerC